MKMIKASIVICSLLAFAAISQIPVSQAPTGKAWAVLVNASGNVGSNETQMLYNVLIDHYNFEDIYYLHLETSFPGVDAKATKANFRWALTNWLSSHSTANDFVLIYVVAHGGGYSMYDNAFVGLSKYMLADGRAEVAWDNQGKPAYSDEGMEVLEQNLLNGCRGPPLDVNGDGDLDDWVGVDECIKFIPLSDPLQRYWDDEVAADLSGLSYKTLAFVYVGCTAENSTEHCFSGGFIDDLSAPNRIIITPTNETWPSWGAYDENKNLLGYSFWGKEFISAFDVDTLAFNEADVDSSGKVSFKEAFDYAWNHDPARTGEVPQSETPWLDDNGNGLPTFVQGQDVLDPTDGQLASQTYLGTLKSPDINKDGVIDIADVVSVALSFMAIRDHPNPEHIYIERLDLNDDGYIDIEDIVIVAIHFEERYH